MWMNIEHMERNICSYRGSSNQKSFVFRCIKSIIFFPLFSVVLVGCHSLLHMKQGVAGFCPRNERRTKRSRKCLKRPLNPQIISHELRQPTHYYYREKEFAAFIRSSKYLAFSFIAAHLLRNDRKLVEKLSVNTERRIKKSERPNKFNDSNINSPLDVKY